MWNLIRSLLFGAQPDSARREGPANADPTRRHDSNNPQPSQPAAHVPAVLRDQIQRILATDFSTDAARELHNEAVYQTLVLLNDEIEKIRQRANGYPVNPISADVWVTGTQYAGLACALTQHFQAAGWLKREETASGLWAKATLAVTSHYHHLVGPAMLANAACHERLGNLSRAAEMYTGVVRDFAVFADEWQAEAAAQTGNDRTSLECLKTAVERMLDLGHATIEQRDLKALRAAIDDILCRPPAE